MKLIYAIVHDEDSPRLMAELNRARLSGNQIKFNRRFSPFRQYHFDDCCR